jgi:hypothetical protein
VTGEEGTEARPDPFGGAEGVEPFVWTHDEGPAEPAAYAPAHTRPPVETPRTEPARPEVWTPVVTEEAPDPAAPLGAVRSPVLAPSPRAGRPGGLATGLLITLLVSGPILLVELNWRGAGVTAQPHYLWALAFAAGALSFVAGGVVIGLRAGSTGEAFVQGIALALLSCGLLTLAALVRQLIVGHHFPRASTYLWFVIEIGVLIWCAAGGALLGRLFSLRSSGG